MQTTSTFPYPAVWSIEAWRGLAALMVLAAHVHPFLGWSPAVLKFAFTGVDLFFALSGYVFAPYLFGQRSPVTPFLVRRLFRIYPAYLIALALYVLVAWHQSGTMSTALTWLPEHLLMLHLQSREVAFAYNPAFWSLPTEVSFYLLVAATLALSYVDKLQQLLRGARFWTALVLVTLVCSVGLNVAADPAAQNYAYVLGFHLPGRLIEFLFGAIAWRLQPLLLDKPVARMGLFLAGIAGWLALAIVFDRLGDAGLLAAGLFGQIEWMAALCAALAIAGSAHWVPDKGDLRSMGIWAGRLSFGTYLLHHAAIWAVTDALGLTSPWRIATAVLCLTLACSWCLHRFCEDPARRMGRKLANRLEMRAAK